MKMPALIVSILIAGSAFGQNWSADQKKVLDAMEGLSKTTSEAGLGADDYADFLAEEFSRWTMGSNKTEDKESWLASIKEWFDLGWRVSDKVNNVKEISISNNLAFVRRIVAETYKGPDGELTEPSRAALSEIWVLDTSWKLLRVEVIVVP